MCLHDASLGHPGRPAASYLDTNFEAVLDLKGSRTHLYDTACSRPASVAVYANRATSSLGPDGVILHLGP
jgi:hypothetical protein